MLFKKKKVVSFLCSVRGINATAVIRSIQAGTIPAKTGLLLCDRPDAGARARDLNVLPVLVDPNDYPTKHSHEHRLIELLESCNTDLVVCAGYMRMLSPSFVRRFKNRAINIHPSLLPDFPGKNAQEQALAAGVSVTGCTAHFVDEGMDTGPIILQSPVKIGPSDTVMTLSQKILKEEVIILPEAVRLFCEDRLTVLDGKAVIV